MTIESFSKLKELLLTYKPEEDCTNATALDVYNKILEIVKPVCNVRCISDDVLYSILLKYDYRNDTFQQDVDVFCSDIGKLLSSILSDDNMIIVVVSILVYCKSTDIKLNGVNNLINDICSVEYNSLEDTIPDISLMADLFKHNIIGSKTLSVDSASQMMKVVSSASDLLGSSCVNSPSNEICCANNCLKTPEELGIRTDLILRLNQLVQNGEPIEPTDFMGVIHSLSIDANNIGLDKSKPTIYDIVNIRFCWFFNWIYHWILHTPSEETGKQILRTVINSLLYTDKSFMNEDDNPFLTLEEMVLNTLDHMVNGKGYYTHIRAKNLNYKGGCRYSPKRLNSQSKMLIDLEREILKDLNKNGYFAPSVITEGLNQSTLFNTDVNLGNCRDGNGSTENLYESMSALQAIELDGDFQSHEGDPVFSDVKKLLGESFKLSTMLDKESGIMKARFNESVQWIT